MTALAFSLHATEAFPRLRKILPYPLFFFLSVFLGNATNQVLVGVRYFPKVAGRMLQTPDRA